MTHQLGITKRSYLRVQDPRLSNGALGAVKAESLELASGATVVAILDEDAMGSNSDTALVTQQSLVAYVTGAVAAEDLWDRTGANITPSTASGIVNVDNIIEETGSAGTTINGTVMDTGGIVTANVLNVNLPADDNITIDGTTNPRSITEGVLRINHQPAINSTRAVHVEMTNDGYDDTRCFSMNYDLAGSSASSNVHGLFETIDVQGATNHHVAFLHAEVTGVVDSSMAIHALHVQPSIDPIDHMSGAYVNIEQAFTYDGGFTDVTADFNNAGSDVQLWVSNGDIVYIGKATPFNNVDVQLAIGSSNPGIKPGWAFSDGVGSFATLSASDSTNGFKNSGVLSWEMPATWSSEDVNSVTLYWVRITRTQPTLGTVPTEDKIQYQQSIIYQWQADGDVNINDLECADADMSGTLTLSALTEGSVLYAGAGGVVSEDNAGLFFDAGNNYLGVGTATPGNSLDIITGATTHSGIHMGETLDEGGYLTSISDSQLFVSGGMEYVSGAWVARSTFAESIIMSQGNMSFSADSSLVDGNPVTPTTRMSINTVGMQLGGANARVTTILDEDTLSTDSATALATQQSIKSYVDSNADFTQIDITTGATTSSAFHIGEAVDEGAWLTSSTPSQLIVGGGSEIVANVWTARHTLATAFAFQQAGGMTIYADDSLTDGVGFTPTQRAHINVDGLILGGANATVTTIYDTDAMTEDSATALATQQSIKAYVDNSVSTSGPYWSAAGTGTQDNVTGDNTLYTLLWATEVYDTGSILNGGTGIVTMGASDGGYYHISYVVTVNGILTANHTDILVDLVHSNGPTIHRNSQEVYNNGQLTIAGSADVLMANAETLTLKVQVLGDNKVCDILTTGTRWYGHRVGI